VVSRNLRIGTLPVTFSRATIQTTSVMVYEETSSDASRTSSQQADSEYEKSIRASSLRQLKTLSPFQLTRWSGKE